MNPVFYLLSRTTITLLVAHHIDVIFPLWMFCVMLVGQVFVGMTCFVPFTFATKFGSAEKEGAKLSTVRVFSAPASNVSIARIPGASFVAPSCRSGDIFKRSAHEDIVETPVVVIKSSADLSGGRGHTPAGRIIPTIAEGSHRSSSSARSGVAGSVSIVNIE